VALFPDFFRIGADGKAGVLKQPEKSREEEMAAVCPVEAIKISEK
jgi:ferredoxin